MTTLAHTQPAINGLQHVMSLAGWHIDFVDLDLTQGNPVVTVRCHRTDGRWVRAHVDQLGRCTLESFQRQSWLGRPANAKGRWPQSPQVDDFFLGRQKPQGARSMLRLLTAYIADNALAPVALTDVRSAWAAVMASPLRIQHTPSTKGPK